MSVTIRGKPHLEVGKQRVAALLMVGVAHCVVNCHAADFGSKVCVWQIQRSASTMPATV